MRAFQNGNFQSCVALVALRLGLFVTSIWIASLFLAAFWMFGNG
jgi:hypothetical protein